ncbi:hypothetical protein [Cellulomonas sp. PhB143]|uniref:hypothetical protein n=1 Tax=Cellulomonas sp. PhB143 TaxID=2485186 RepID=UPI000F461037|nr:hypothetical protein [Cellulomonas sp. PhB143]ROS79064.1 hypothetical protein EDF32_0110 [Cellulomonas sp. PhB143]
MPRRVDLAPVLALAAAQEGLVGADQCARLGVARAVLARRAASGAWLRIATGVYDTSPRSARDHDARRRRAAWAGLLALGPGAVAVGSCALALLGVAGLPPTIRPEATLGESARRPRGLVVPRQFDDGMTCVRVGGRLVASPEWALAQAVPELPRRNGLAVLDSVLAQRMLTPRGLRRAHDLARGRRGVARTHDLWGLADAGGESPLESFARLECVDAGLPPDRLQLEVRDDDGTFVGRGDLAWWLGDGRWLVAELDGRDVHGSPEAVYADRVRQNAMLSTGRVVLLRFTSADLPRLAATIGRELARHRRRPAPAPAPVTATT